MSVSTEGFEDVVREVVDSRVDEAVNSGYVPEDWDTTRSPEKLVELLTHNAVTWLLENDLDGLADEVLQKVS